MGRDRMSSSRFIVTELDPNLGAIFAVNAANAAYPDAIAFVDIGEEPSQFTADRREFLGRNGDPKSGGGARALGARSVSRPPTLEPRLASK